MTAAIPNINFSCVCDPLWNRAEECGVASQNACNNTTSKIKELVVSPVGQIVLGFGIGLGAHQIYGPITQRVLDAAGLTIGSITPFHTMGIASKIASASYVCIFAPIVEELLFRGSLQECLKESMTTFYTSMGLSGAQADMAARVTSVFFTSIIFGLAHFLNALTSWSHPVLFVPQVIAATIMGVIFGLAKEATGELFMPIGMHIGNNTLAWAAHSCV